MSTPRRKGGACHVFKHAEEKACPQCGQAMTEVNVPPDPEAEAMAHAHRVQTLGDVPARLGPAA